MYRCNIQHNIVLRMKTGLALVPFRVQSHRWPHKNQFFFFFFFVVGISWEMRTPWVCFPASASFRYHQQLVKVGYFDLLSLCLCLSCPSPIGIPQILIFSAAVLGEMAFWATVMYNCWVQIVIWKKVRDSSQCFAICTSSTSSLRQTLIYNSITK